ncbi:MAG TPA: sensor histidine kinase [Chryseosolibacter sp.]|nr:sensor histidine kinase [Chryseosolibacter sp.]
MENAVGFDIIREIAEVSLDGVIVYNLAEKRLIFANSRAFELVGLRHGSSKFDIETLLERVVPQDREYLKNQYLTVRDKYLTGEVEFQLTSSSDQPMFLCCNAYLISDKSAIIVFVKDITKAKVHEDYIVNYGARKNTALDSLAHQVSGALNLMRHLSSEAEALINHSTDKNLKVYLGLLNDNSTHCLQIIHELLRNEHEASPTIATKNSRINLVNKISIIHHELQQNYRKRKFLFISSADSLHVTTDEVKLLQIINNFTSNAIKFSRPEDPITIKIEGAQDEVTVSVTDLGIGIPEHLRPLIFESQFGAGRTGLNGEKSIGLGLSICKNLSDILNGTIGFESSEGKGSTFYFTLSKT